MHYCLSAITPSHEGFENSLRILYRLAEDELTGAKSIAKDMGHNAVLAHISDTNFLV